MRRGSYYLDPKSFPKDAWILKTAFYKNIFTKLAIICNNVLYLKKFHNKDKYNGAFYNMATALASVADNLFLAQPQGLEFFAAALNPLATGVSEFTRAHQEGKLIQCFSKRPTANMKSALHQLSITKPQLTSEISKALGMFHGVSDGKVNGEQRGSQEQMQQQVREILLKLIETFTWLEKPLAPPKNSCGAVINRAFSFNFVPMVAGFGCLSIAAGIGMDKAIDAFLPDGADIFEYALLAIFVLVGLLLCMRALCKGHKKPVDPKMLKKFEMSYFPNIKSLLFSSSAGAELLGERKANSDDGKERGLGLTSAGVDNGGMGLPLLPHGSDSSVQTYQGV